MKKTILFGFLAIMLLAYRQPVTAPAATRPAASYEPVIKRIKASDLHEYIAGSDHPLIVSFWATFCEPCNKEIPYLQRIAEQYKDQGVELLLVSLDLRSYYPEKIRAFALQKDYHCRLVWLDETDADYFCPLVDKKWSGGIPASLFCNNKTHYRQFFDRQLTEPQVALTIKAMVTD